MSQAPEKKPIVDTSLHGQTKYRFYQKSDTDHKFGGESPIRGILLNFTLTKNICHKTSVKVETEIDGVYNDKSCTTKNKAFITHKFDADLDFKYELGLDTKQTDVTAFNNDFTIQKRVGAVTVDLNVNTKREDQKNTFGQKVGLKYKFNDKVHLFSDWSSRNSQYNIGFGFNFA